MLGGRLKAEADLPSGTQHIGRLLMLMSVGDFSNMPFKGAFVKKKKMYLVIVTSCEWEIPY